MKNRMFLIVLIPVLWLTGCASLLPVEERKTTLVARSDSGKEETYSRTLIFLAKTYGADNQTILVRDPAKGKIRVKAKIDCNILRAFSDTNNYDLSFEVSLLASDKKLMLDFEDLQITERNTGESVLFGDNQISDRDKLQKSRLCLQTFVSKLGKAINTTTEPVRYTAK
jgi:hypothetical protein